MKRCPKVVNINPVSQLGIWAVLMMTSAIPAIAVSAETANRDALIALGAFLFQDRELSQDGKTSCRSCHDPVHAYADPHPRSVGASDKVGTRNAPSLVGLNDAQVFFWDGRRTHLEDAVLDPFTNPFELGLSSQEAVLKRLSKSAIGKFRNIFGSQQAPTIEQVSASLAAFVRSLGRASLFSSPASAMANDGRRLFALVGCAECHVVNESGIPDSDGQYHHSGIGEATRSPQLQQLAQDVLRENLDASALGPRVLANPQWSELGRFVVSHHPADIGAFRTPSLRNVGVTAPYMHDGSIPTLAEAVDHEIYYHSTRRGRPVNLSQTERLAIVAFLETLTDSPEESRTAVR